MLSRIAYVLIILCVILGGAFAMNFLVEEPGSLSLDYGGNIYELTLFDAAMLLVIGIIGILVVITLVRFVIALIRFIGGDENAFGGFWTRRRERRGLDALSKGMLALAAGDAKTAQKKAKIAEQRLMRPELTRLLNAQAAVLAGENAKAERYFKAMMAEPDTAFVGTQGLLTQALDAGDTNRAIKLAEHARELNPKDEKTLETLYLLQSRNFDWDGARKTLTLQRKAGHVQKLEAARRESGLLVAQAEDAQELGEEEHARALAVDAAKKDPSNVKAVTTAVHLLIASGSRKAASKLVMDAWRVQPHPALAAAYAAIEPDESPAARRRRFEGLFTLQPEHDETRFLKAELSLVAEDWGGARNAIQDLRETEPSARSCAIMAAIARGEGEPDHVVRGWLARALSAPRKEGSETEISNAAMLPLLIGADPQPEPAADTSATMHDATEETSEDAIVEEVEDAPPDSATDAPKKSEAAA